MKGGTLRRAHLTKAGARGGKLGAIMLTAGLRRLARGQILLLTRGRLSPPCSRRLATALPTRAHLVGVRRHLRVQRFLTPGTAECVCKGLAIRDAMHADPLQVRQEGGAAAIKTAEPPTNRLAREGRREMGEAGAGEKAAHRTAAGHPALRLCMRSTTP